MFKKIVYFLVIVVFILLNSVSLSSQNSVSIENKQQLEFRHDNDFVLFTDRYYSSGLFLSYRKLLSKGFFKPNREQLDFILQQEVYTPSQTQSTNSEIFDRPYVGFSSVTASWSTATESQLFRTDILLGIAGLNSGAGGLQRAFHDLVGILNSPLWVNELANSFHINLYLSYVKEWQIAPTPFGISFALIPNIALGSRDIYVAPESVVYFGKKNKVTNSISYNRLGVEDNELYFALRSGYRRVFYNGLIEGNLFGDNSLLTQDSTNNVLFFGLDLNRRLKRSDYKFGVRYNSAETDTASGHAFVTVSYGLRF